jgi:hypothetical protein
MRGTPAFVYLLKSSKCFIPYVLNFRGATAKVWL